MEVFNSYEVTEAGEQYSQSLKALMLPVIDSFYQSTISNADEPLTNQGKAKENTYYQQGRIQTYGKGGSKMN